MAKRKKKGKRGPAPKTAKRNESRALVKASPAAVERVPRFGRPVKDARRKKRGGRGRMSTSEGGKKDTKDILIHIGAGLAGGAAGAAAGGLLVKTGLPPLAAAGIVAGAGGVGTYALKGYARSAAAGVGAAGAGQFALTLMAKKPARTAAQGQAAQGRRPVGGRRRNAELPPADVYRAMQEARDELRGGYRNAPYDDDYRNAPYDDDYRNAPYDEAIY
jgi:hypothetical protein